MRASADSLVLASRSRARADLLARAEVPFEAVPSALDEDDLKRSLRRGGIDGAPMAAALAERKAADVSQRMPGRLVLGADQVLEHKGGVFDKPADRTAAAAQLRALRGERHTLVSAACVVRDRRPVWRRSARARLWVRPFSEAFLECYLDSIGGAALDGPGAYRVEGLGIQLFERIEGSWPTVLGLPLLPLLAFLRRQGVLAT